MAVYCLRQKILVYKKKKQTEVSHMEQSKTGLAAIFAAIIVMMGCNTMDNNHTRRPQNGEPLPYHELVEPRLLSYKGGHFLVLFRRKVAMSFYQSQICFIPKKVNLHYISQAILMG